MIPYVRKEKILELIRQQRLVYLPEILKLTPDISESTIRRDLKLLEAEGKIESLHGGAVKLCEVVHTDSISEDIPFVQKLSSHAQVKERICRYAATLVQNGDVVYLDASTTVLPMLGFLRDLQITIVTCSASLPNLIADAKYTCVLLGGEVKKDTASVVGPITESVLSSMHFDKAFIGANGFSKTTGVSTPDFREAQKKRIVKQNSDQTYFLIDHSKYDLRMFCKVFELEECFLITDEECDLLAEFEGYTVVPPERND